MTEPITPSTSLKSKKSIYLRILAIFVVVILSLTIFYFREQAQKLAFLGYPGVFLLAFMAYATVILPAPGLAIIFTMGGILSSPLLVALFASLGATCGELSGYLAGFGGQVVVERTDIYNRLIYWMQKNGALTILLLSAIPNPIFDLAGFTAGALKVPLKKFILWCFIGQTIKMLIFAYAGSGILNRFF